MHMCQEPVHRREVAVTVFPCQIALHKMSLDTVGHHPSHSTDPHGSLWIREQPELKPTTANNRFYLASQSPRRAELIRSIGLDCDIGPSGIDDGLLDPGDAEPSSWVMALAYLKAAAGVRSLQAQHGTCAYQAVLGADTVCELGSDILGQPTDEDHAFAMIRSMVGRPHAVMSGLALVCPSSGQRMLYCDTAVVTLGSLSSADIETYVHTGQWRGKAGGYNISERLAAGWPITCDGDPCAVMGLATDSLRARIDEFLAILVQSQT
jgi:septum formation protein